MNEMRWTILLVGLVVLAWIYITGRRQQKAEKHDVFKNAKEAQSDALLRQHAQDEATVLDTDATPEPDFRETLANLNEPQANLTPEPDLRVTQDYAPDPVEEEPALPDPFDSPMISAEPESELEPPASAVAEAEAQGQEVAETEVSQTPDFRVFVLYVTAPLEQPFKGRAVLKAFHAHKLLFGDQDIFHRYHKRGTEREVVFSVANMFKPGTLVQQDLINGEVKGLSLFMQVPGPNDPISAYDEMLHCAQHLANTLNGELRDDTVQALLTQEKIAADKAMIEALLA